MTVVSDFKGKHGGRIGVLLDLKGAVAFVAGAVKCGLAHAITLGIRHLPI
jgi:hypothetical protein